MDEVGVVFPAGQAEVRVHPSLLLQSNPPSTKKKCIGVSKLEFMCSAYGVHIYIHVSQSPRIVFFCSIWSTLRNCPHLVALLPQAERFDIWYL